MRRLRLLFLVFTVALLAPVSLLVHRALQSLTLEEQMRQRALAERIFDEMERSLSRLLEREEERPLREPGVETPSETLPFVLGRFQVDPEGHTSTTWSQSAGEDVPGAYFADQADEGKADLERVVGNLSRAEAEPAAQKRGVAGQLPGTTVEVGGRTGGAAAIAAKDKRENRDEYDVSALDALRSLNKGVRERIGRQFKRSASDGLLSAVPDDAASAREGGAGDRAATMPGQELLESAGDGPQLTPMRGRITDARHLLLSRTVVREGRAYRQGVVLDVEELTDWLSEQGLGNGLAKLARVGFTTRFSTPDSVRRDQLVYRHRFADPFDALTAHLTLLPLRSTGTATYVYTLCALLLAAIVLGLASLYRMVSVIVGFAERRSNFVAAVSHELKTPLTAIRMYGEMLRDGIVSSEAKRAEYYRHITSESERLSRLINNVLEFSRLEQGNREMILTTGSIGPTIREVAELLRPHAQAHGFELRLDIATDLPHVRFEPDAVMQILWNLVDNAVKYAGESAPKRITVSCLGDAGSVRLAVRDSGPGVAPRHLTKIFEPFYRDENELTRRSRGTGLGLALVRSLAERLGARVNGRNLKDGGFEVEIVFRAAPE